MNTIRIGFIGQERYHHYEPIFSHIKSLGLHLKTYHVEDDHALSCIDILFSSDEFAHLTSLLVAESNRRGIPTLHIADGAIEWRNTWENPRGANEKLGLPLFQPIISSKIACIGPQQGRLLSSFGQFHKVEVTGIPRLDRLFPLAAISRHILYPPSSKGHVKILVATANTPGFTIDQINLVNKTLYDLNSFFLLKSQSLCLDVSWRVSNLVALPDCLVGDVDDMRNSLQDQLLKADVYICTPSTSVLEAMTLDIPTCIIDYTNSPAYLLTAWRITCQSQISTELSSLVLADPKRMLYQRYLVHDQLRLDSPASPRVFDLIYKMVQIATAARETGKLPSYPASLVSSSSYDEQSLYCYEPSQLFPAHPIFSRSDTDILNAEIGHLRIVVAGLRKVELQLRMALSRRALLRRYLSKILGFARRFFKI